MQSKTIQDFTNLSCVNKSNAKRVSPHGNLYILDFFGFAVRVFNILIHFWFFAFAHSLKSYSIPTCMYLPTIIHFLVILDRSYLCTYVPRYYHCNRLNIFLVIYLCLSVSNVYNFRQTFFPVFVDFLYNNIASGNVFDHIHMYALTSQLRSPECLMGIRPLKSESGH
jgi:hypothetical protein